MEIERKFNLLEEPWIKVVMVNGSESEVSLKEVFQLAPEIMTLNGELETQNTALMRLLLAIMYSSLITNPNSEYQQFEIPDDAIDLWADIWEEKRLPVNQILEYLEKQKDSFWLFHPERPFMQSNIAVSGTEYKTSKLIGDLSESSNKIRLFQSRAGNEKDVCSFGEAARWLLYLNAYDDTSAKPKSKGLGSPGAGWLGKLGQVYLKGRSLFETLMLNFCLLKDGEALWSSGKPYWESTLPAKERDPIELPNNPAELLTIRSRWLLLESNGDSITGFKLLGGNYFSKENALTEQYTVWRPVFDGKKKDRKIIGYTPRRHEAHRQIWRDFANIVPINSDDNKGGRTPGVVAWVQKLLSEQVLDDQRLLALWTCSVQYGDQYYYVNDLTGDSFSVHMSMLKKLNYAWRERVFLKIKTCEKFAYAAGELAKEIALASGASGDAVLESAIDKGRETAYEMLNTPFRGWLRSIQPESQEIDENVFDEWHKTARRLASNLVKVMENSSTDAAVFGRSANDQHYSLIEAVNHFFARVNRYYPDSREGIYDKK